MTTAPTTVLLVEPSLGDPGRLAFLGLFGLLVLLLVVAQIEHGLATFGGGGESSSVRSKPNCPACGARIAADADQCPHCERSLGDDDEAPDYGRVETEAGPELSWARNDPSSSAARRSRRGRLATTDAITTTIPPRDPVGRIR